MRYVQVRSTKAATQHSHFLISLHSFTSSSAIISNASDLASSADMLEATCIRSAKQYRVCSCSCALERVLRYAHSLALRAQSRATRTVLRYAHSARATRIEYGATRREPRATRGAYLAMRYAQRACARSGENLQPCSARRSAARLWPFAAPGQIDTD